MPGQIAPKAGGIGLAEGFSLSGQLLEHRRRRSLAERLIDKTAHLFVTDVQPAKFVQGQLVRGADAGFPVQ